MRHLAGSTERTSAEERCASLVSKKERNTFLSLLHLQTLIHLSACPGQSVWLHEQKSLQIDFLRNIDFL